MFSFWIKVVVSFVYGAQHISNINISFYTLINTRNCYCFHYFSCLYCVRCLHVCSQKQLNNNNINSEYSSFSVSKACFVCTNFKTIWSQNIRHFSRTIHHIRGAGWLLFSSLSKSYYLFSCKLCRYSVYFFISPND